MKKIFLLFLLSSLFGTANAQFQSKEEMMADTVKLLKRDKPTEIIAPGDSATILLTKEKPIYLGRHHIAFAWWGFSKAMNDRLKQSYVDASMGEGGFLNYRYSYSKHIDLVIDERGFINDADNDDLTVNLKAEVFYSGFGIRYNFDRYRLLYPYVQCGVYRTSADIGTTCKLSRAAHPEMYWGLEGEGWGVGISCGVDIRLGKLISIPVDLSYVYSNPELVYKGYQIADDPNTSWLEIDDVVYKESFNISGVLLSAGFSFNWGKVK